MNLVFNMFRHPGMLTSESSPEHQLDEGWAASGFLTATVFVSRIMAETKPMPGEYSLNE